MSARLHDRAAILAEREDRLVALLSGRRSCATRAEAGVGELGLERRRAAGRRPEARRQVRAREVVVGREGAEELGLRLRRRGHRLEGDEARDVAHDEVEVADDARRAEAQVPGLDHARRRDRVGELVLRRAFRVVVLQVLLEEVALER